MSSSEQPGHGNRKADLELAESNGLPVNARSTGGRTALRYYFSRFRYGGPGHRARGVCSCGSTQVRHSRPWGWEHALRLILVRPYRCEQCQKRFYRFVPAMKWASRNWAKFEARQLKEKLRVEQAITESNLWRTRAFEQESRAALNKFAASLEHAVALFNKEFRRNQKIELEFGRIPDGFVLKKHFDPLAWAEIRLDTSNETVRFSITRHGSTQVFTKALKFDTSDRICFEQANGLLSVDDASIALFQYVLDKKSNLSSWFAEPGVETPGGTIGSKGRDATN